MLPNLFPYSRALVGCRIGTLSLKLWKFLPFGQVSIIVSKAISGDKLTINRIYKLQCVLPIHVLTLRLSDARKCSSESFCRCEDEVQEVKVKLFER